MLDVANFSLALDDIDDALPTRPAAALPVTASLERLPTPQAWDALAGQAAEPNPFHERWFLRPAFRHLGEAGTRLLTVWEGERLLGLLPVCARRGAGRVPVRFSTNWAHDRSLPGTPLVRSGHEQAFWRAALASLDGHPETDLIQFSNLPEGGPILRALLAVAGETGRAAAIVGREPADSPRPGVAARNESGDVRAQVFDQTEQLTSWVDDWLHLAASDESDAPLRQHPKARAFLTEVIAAAHRRGRLHLTRYDRNGCPAAMTCALLGAGSEDAFPYGLDGAAPTGGARPTVHVRLAKNSRYSRAAFRFARAAGRWGGELVRS